MSRRPAVVTQADVARAIRAAKSAGAATVEIRPDGTIVVRMEDKGAAEREREYYLERAKDIVL